MAALALHGLGRPEADVLAWHDGYCERLTPLDGSPDGYLTLLDETERELTRLGREALLTRTLPGLISGWAKNAYHPLIRLAYGYHFQIDGEIAAGLAYLKWCGPDARIESLAASARMADGPADLPAVFAGVEAAASSLGPGRRFDENLTEVVGHPAFAAAASRHSDALAGFSRTALDIFDQTHDFFALHLVTGAHAFRVLYPFTGALRDGIFGLGILAGYAAIGAPAFVSHQKTESDRAIASTSELGAAVTSSDDHDIKLAYSALSQSRHFRDAAYIEVARRYLGR